MSAVFTTIAVTIVAAWVRVYTWPLETSVRDRRRAEIESDLWEGQADAAHAGLAGAAHVLLRLVMGIPSDLGWCVERAAQPGAVDARRLVLAVATVAVAVWWAAASTNGRPLPATQPVATPIRVVFTGGPPPPPPPRRRQGAR